MTLPQPSFVEYASLVVTMRSETTAGGEPELLTTGEMARRSNNTLRTVRFYEEEGILRPVKRSDGGHRLFEPSELDRLQLVTDLRALGLSLDDIKAVLELKSSGASASDAAKKALLAVDERIRDLRAKLATLTRLEQDLRATADVLHVCVACNDASFPESCAKCTKLGDTNELPRGMRVLWATCGGGQR